MSRLINVIKINGVTVAYKYDDHTEQILNDGCKIYKVHTEDPASFIILPIIWFRTNYKTKKLDVYSSLWFDGTIIYVNERGLVHRDDGPAITYKRGSPVYVIEGHTINPKNLHRGFDLYC